MNEIKVSLNRHFRVRETLLYGLVFLFFCGFSIAIYKYSKGQILSRHEKIILYCFLGMCFCIGLFALNVVIAGLYNRLTICGEKLLIRELWHRTNSIEKEDIMEVKYNQSRERDGDYLQIIFDKGLYPVNINKAENSVALLKWIKKNDIEITYCR